MNNYSCPSLSEDVDVITLAHGSGGKDTSRLIEKLFLPTFLNEHLGLLHDGAALDLSSNKIAFTTDSYVIQPIFFPGGDIGKLAVTGTVNDLAMCGAQATYLSCSFIIEEGFLQKDLEHIVQSIQKEASSQSVQIVTGDTKVIERQKGGNIFINTSGIGIRIAPYPINPLQIQPRDSLIVSGDIGRHGMAVMAAREGLSFSSPLLSDCASLFPLVHALLKEGIHLHCLRDLTRGGLATALLELSEKSLLSLSLFEEKIPVSQEVYSATELLGFDPLYVANEGRFIACVPEQEAHRAVEILHSFEEGKEAQIIGTALERSTTPSVQVTNSFGSIRALYKLSGEQLPRIC